MAQFHTVRQVIDFAVSLERASQQFYQKLAEDVTEAPVKSFLLQLVEEEKLHEAALLNAVSASDLQPDKPMVADTQVAAYVQAVKLPDPLDYAHAVRLAREKENASRALYLILAGAAEKPALEELFSFLAEQELRHQHFFEKEYNRIDIGRN